ncbi:NERD domain-containing protein [Salimicrobium halophilum]|uniref:NERD domain-containing protein n=1 Tax=Salimicrobium halophilum TaxID=86666 RepID=A0A1G8VMM6_9BACI|nr:NERD domain-containing protein [Salimicrobium halophilum]SDJ66655.1 hypothetical protein SAMN04490247_2774 [Salimicrobium halophilum]
MAQLIKLQDYISRYETNVYQYSSQFIQMKTANWKGLQDAWKRGQLPEPENDEEPSEQEEEGVMKRMWKKMRKKDDVDIWQEEETVSKVPATEDELKIDFLDRLLSFQLKWASTTIQEKSFLDRSYEQDPLLKFYLQRFPDTYLLMFNPHVEMKRAILDLEQLLIGPHELDIIVHLDVEEDSAIYPEEGKSWYIEDRGIRKKIPNPLLSLQRAETYVRSVFHTYGHSFPYRKIVLAPKGHFAKTTRPYQTDYIGKEEYEGWMNEKRMLKMPLKHAQLKTAQLLLKHTRTTSVRRPEWEETE